MIFAGYFSGIGGAELAVQMVSKATKSECKTVLFCEIVENRWPILRKNFDINIPIFPDIEKVGKEELEKENIDIDSIDCSILSLPCQVFSYAGNRMGDQDHSGRYLLDEVVRVVKITNCNWVCCENVDGIISMEEGLDSWQKQMNDLGYHCEVVSITSCGVGAPHERERVAMIAYKDCIKESMRTAKTLDIPMGNPEIWNGRDIQNPGIEKFVTKVPTKRDKARLSEIGNSINPYQFFPVFRLMKHFDDHYKATIGQIVNKKTRNVEIDEKTFTGPFVRMLQNFSLYKTPWVHGKQDWNHRLTPNKTAVLQQIQTVVSGQVKPTKNGHKVGHFFSKENALKCSAENELSLG